MEDQVKALEMKALGIVEKHVEAMAEELLAVAKEYGDVALENANPLVKVLYGASKEQIVVALKAIIEKLDLDKDGK